MTLLLWAIFAALLITFEGQAAHIAGFASTSSTSARLKNAKFEVGDAGREASSPAATQSEVHLDGTSSSSSSSRDIASSDSISYSRKSLTIGLHAQVNPGSGVIVGSVITTAGLMRAFQKRSRRDVKIVHLMNPSNYSEYFTVVYDLVIIEGWFLSIDNFISVTRATNPHVIVFFYCLDPSFPDLPTIAGLDVDGYLSNSKRLVKEVLSKIAPAIYLPLAADTESMAPLDTVKDRDLNIVYIGAGGAMIQAKPMLRNTLEVASDFGLTIYGSRWNEIPEFIPFWQGVLPLQNISYAYSRAKIVLVSTISTQSDNGMVNNRAFEALSCGSVVIAEHFDALEEMFGSAMLYTSSAEQTRYLIESVLGDPQGAQLLRTKAREAILTKHNWGYRVVDILSFYHEVMRTRGSQIHGAASSSASSYSSGIFFHPSPALEASSNPSCPRTNCLKMVIVISEFNNNEIKHHSDYLFFMKNYLFNKISSVYAVEILSENDWIEHISIEVKGQLYWSVEKLRSYDIILGVISAFDSLDLTLRQISRSGDLLSAQRIMAYLFGIRADTIDTIERKIIVGSRDGGGSEVRKNFHDFSHYDVIMNRINADIEYLSSALGIEIDSRRIKHIFGFDIEGVESDARWRNTRASKYKKLLKKSDENDGRISSGSSRSSSNGYCDDHNDGIIKELYVCFWQYIQYCNILPSSSTIATKSSERAFLLLGASLHTFIDSNLMSSAILSDTSNIYALNEHHSDLIVSLFKASEKVVISIPYELIISSMEVIWWPLMLATQLERQIHVLGINDIVSESLSMTPLWSSAYLQDQLDDAHLRTHLFPRTVSSFSLERLVSINSSPEISPRRGTGNNADMDVYDGDGMKLKAIDRSCLIKRMSEVSPRAFNSSQRHDLSEDGGRRFDIAVFAITYDSFRPGYDGTLCMSYKLSPHLSPRARHSTPNIPNSTSDSVVKGTSCQIWPFRYIVPVLQSGGRTFFFRSDFLQGNDGNDKRDEESSSSDDSRICNAGCESATISLQLQPFMSLDVFYSSKISLKFIIEEYLRIDEGEEGEGDGEAGKEFGLDLDLGSRKSLIPSHLDLLALDKDSCTRDIVFYPIDVGGNNPQN